MMSYVSNVGDGIKIFSTLITGQILATNIGLKRTQGNFAHMKFISKNHVQIIVFNMLLEFLFISAVSFNRPMTFSATLLSP